MSRAFASLPVASRWVFAYIVYIFLPPSSAFEARLEGKSIADELPNSLTTVRDTSLPGIQPEYLVARYPVP